MLQIDAVNRMLTYVGEIRLAADTNLETLDEGSDGQVALQTLRDVTRDILLKEWWFNTFDSWTLVPDVDGYISIPLSYYRVIADNYIVDDHKLYNVVDQTYKHSNNVTVKLIVDKPFDDLPESMAKLIMYTASKDFSLRTLGVTDIYKVLEREEQLSLLEVQKEHFDFKNTGINLVDEWGITDPTTSRLG